MGESNKVVETIEDGIFKTEFTIEEGYLVGIKLEVKSVEDIDRVNTNDRVAFSKWLAHIRGALFNAVSNPPVETIEIGVVGLLEQKTDTPCKVCGGEIVKKKACCGSKGDVLRCNKCGRSYRLVEGRAKGTAPSPSPVTA